MPPHGVWVSEATSPGWRWAGMAALAISAATAAHAGTHNWGWGAMILAPACGGLGLVEGVLAVVRLRRRDNAVATSLFVATALAWGAAWWGARHASGC